jgi:hypothetical protein
LRNRHVFIAYSEEKQPRNKNITIEDRPNNVEIDARIDGRKSSFSVPGIIDVQVENFINPVTGEEQDTKVQLPKGFIFKIADAAKTKVMKILTPSLNFDDSGKNAFYSVVEFKGP